VRAWRTAAGTFIVECPSLSPGYSYGPDYQEVDGSGAHVASFLAGGSSTQDSIFEHHHEVRGDALVEILVERPDRGEDRMAGRMVRRGLVEIDASTVPVLSRACSDAVARKEAASQRYWEEARAVAAQRLKSPDQLPDLDGDALDFDLAHDGVAAVVVRLGDRVVWSEPANLWPNNRVEEIRSVFTSKYGGRLRSFNGWYDLS
jgi:hypothetical protein